MSRCRATRGLEVRLLPGPDVTTSLIITFCSMFCAWCWHHCKDQHARLAGSLAPRLQHAMHACRASHLQ